MPLNANVLFNDLAALIWTGIPAAHAAPINSGWKPAKDFTSFAVLAQVGANAETVTVLIEEATDASGSNPQTINSDVIANTEVDDVYVYQFPQEKLDLEDDYTHIRVTLTPSGAKLMAGLLIGFGARIGEAGDYNEATKVAGHVTNLLPGNLA